VNKRQQAFVEEYMVDFNGTKAAIRAGYSKASARVTASRLLTNANVQHRLDDLKRAQSRKLTRSRDEAIKALESIAFQNIKDYMESDEHGGLAFKQLECLTTNQIFALASVRVRKGKVVDMKFKDKLRALELLLSIHSAGTADNNNAREFDFDELVGELRQFETDMGWVDA